MPEKEPRTEYASFRLTPGNLEALEQLSASTNNSISNLCWLLLTASLHGMSAREVFPEKFVE